MEPCQRIKRDRQIVKSMWRIDRQIDRQIDIQIERIRLRNDKEEVYSEYQKQYKKDKAKTNGYKQI